MERIKPSFELETVALENDINGAIQDFTATCTRLEIALYVVFSTKYPYW